MKAPSATYAVGTNGGSDNISSKRESGSDMLGTHMSLEQMKGSEHVSIVDETSEHDHFELGDGSAHLSDLIPGAPRSPKRMGSSSRAGGHNTRMGNSSRSHGGRMGNSSRSHGGAAMSGSHTSYVRRTLSHPNPDDESSSHNDFEDDDFDVRAATKRDSVEMGNGRGSITSAMSASGRRQSGSRRSYWKERQNERVDQSVNLMDAETGQYSIRSFGFNSNSKPRAKRSSLVDIFLSDPGDKDSDNGASNAFENSMMFAFEHDNRGRCSDGAWRKWFLLLVFVLAVIVGTLLALPQFGIVQKISNSMVGSDGGGTGGETEAPEVDVQQEANVEQPETSAPVEQAEEELDLEPETSPGEEEEQQDEQDVVLDINNNDSENGQDQEESPSVLDFVARDRPVAVLPPTDLDTSVVPQTSRSNAIKFIVLDQDISAADDFIDQQSAQSLALAWLSDDDGAQLPIPGFDTFETVDDMAAAERQLVERYAMGVVYFSMKGEGGEEGQRSLSSLRQSQQHYYRRHKDKNRELADPSDKELYNRERFDGMWTRKASVCEWYGITCNDSQEITAIDLSLTLLGGTLPREIFRGSGLPQLTSLNLSNNHLFGKLPFVGASSTHPSNMGVPPPENNLQYLFLQLNSIQGTLDPIVDLKKLIYLDIAANEMTGEIPDELAANVKDLETLHLAKCNFEGSLPSNMGTMTQLVNVDLEGNQLYGTVPDEWSQLSNLEILNLAHCENIVGEVPSALQNMPKMKYLSLQKTGLLGKIPDFLGDLKNLKELYLHNTALTGAMPEAVCDLIKNHELEALTSDCSELGEVTCDCCTDCFWR